MTQSPSLSFRRVLLLLVSAVVAHLHLLLLISSNNNVRAFIVGTGTANYKGAIIAGGIVARPRPHRVVRADTATELSSWHAPSARRTRIRQRKQQHPVLLYSSPPSSSSSGRRDGDGDDGTTGANNNGNGARRFLRELRSGGGRTIRRLNPRRSYAKFRALSRTAKKVVVAQVPAGIVGRPRPHQVEYADTDATELGSRRASSSSSSSSSAAARIRTRIRQRRQQQHPVLLFSSPPSSSSGQDGGNNSNSNRARRFLQKLRSKGSRTIQRFNPRRNYAKFRSLSRTAKKVVIAQILVLVMIFGSLAGKVIVNNGPNAPYNNRRPIEIAYSSFLNLVEQQEKASSTAGSSATAAPPPVIDRVRIGSDRIVFRIRTGQLLPEEGGGAVAAQEQPAVATKKKGPGLMKKGNKKQQKAETAAIEATKPLKTGTRRKQQRQPPPYVAAYTRKVPASPELVNLLQANRISFAALPSSKSALALAGRSFFAAFYVLFLYKMYKTISGAAGGGLSSSKDTPGKLASGLASGGEETTSFDDIQGIDEAKNEVMELVDTLRNPDKYAILGARAPTGLLLEGPPGTGKTMLARATAATAGCPLIYCSGSDFVEMFVGRGAARIRKLFERAEKLAPCILFVDELDALGKSRDFGGGMLGGGGMSSRSNDEAEQTLNQLLACMDGLDSSRRVCVLAATNRKEVLDPALIRPGRFDRIVKLKLPDAAGREAILRVHCKKLPGFKEGTGVDPNRQNALGVGRVVDLSAIAAVTDGLSGAELEFVVNEAAIRAVRRVSSALRQGVHASDITPHVESEDFEASLRSFYETRRPNRNTDLSELWKSFSKS